MKPMFTKMLLLAVLALVAMAAAPQAQAWCNGEEACIRWYDRHIVLCDLWLPFSIPEYVACRATYRYQYETCGSCSLADSFKSASDACGCIEQWDEDPCGVDEVCGPDTQGSLGGDTDFLREIGVLPRSDCQANA